MSDQLEDAKAKAERLGLVLVEPKPDEVFVDLDSKDAKKIFITRFDQLKRFWKKSTVRYTRSKGGNCHAYVSIPELSPIEQRERIALQAILNSDPCREIFAILRGRDNYAYTSVFFEVPQKLDELADGFTKALGEICDDFTFVAVEKEPPYAVAVRRLGDASFAIGYTRVMGEI